MVGNEESATPLKHQGISESPQGLRLLPWFFLALIMVAELIVSFSSPTAGLVFHGILIFVFVITSALVYTQDPFLSKLLVAFMLAPMIRVLSLATPLWPFTDTLYWLLVISFPLLAAAFATISVQNLRRRDVGFVVGDWRKLWIQVLIILVGAPLGVVEFLILSPSGWIPTFTLPSFAVGVVIILLGTGLAEEVIFRGIMLHDAEGLMTKKQALLLVSLVFTVLHISFLSAGDLVFVFVVALFFGLAVQKTGSLIGVIGSHTLLNVVLYLVMPFYA